MCHAALLKTSRASSATGLCAQPDHKGETSMLILSLVLANAALMSAANVASAQSPTSYPWCSRSFDRTSNINCYFTSKQQCQTTISGIGAYCFPSPYYRQSPGVRGQAPNPRRPRHR
jgi:hypothetical protein